MENIGKIFGHVKVIGLSHKTKDHRKYYDCVCSCGKEFKRRKDAIQAISCGCRNGKTEDEIREARKIARGKYYRLNKERMKLGAFKVRRNTNGKYSRLKSNARERSIEFDLDKQYYEYLRDQECYYCGEKIPETGGGIDRFTNDRGYVYGNVVPCCFMCNTTKKEYYTGFEFKAMINALKEYRAGQ